MIIGWLVIRKSRCCVLCLAFCLCVSLFSCMSSFNSLHFVPFFSLSASPLPSSFSLNSGWKGHCWILCHSAEKGNEMGMPLIFFLSLSPSISLLRRPPNQARGFPRPLYNRCTIHPIVHLLSCVSALESLLVCQPCRGSQERPAPLLPPLSFSLFPLLTRSCSKLLVFLMCSPVATLKSSGHSFDLDRGPLKKSWVTNDNVLQNQWAPAWQGYDMLSYVWTPGWGRKFFF